MQAVFLMFAQISAVLIVACVQTTAEPWRPAQGPRRMRRERMNESGDRVQVIFQGICTRDVLMETAEKKVVNEQPEVNTAVEALEENLNKA